MRDGELILDRDCVDCIVSNLERMLENEAYYQFKLMFITDKDGGLNLTIVPHTVPCEIVLEKPR